MMPQGGWATDVSGRGRVDRQRGSGGRQTFGCSTWNTGGRPRPNHAFRRRPVSSPGSRYGSRCRMPSLEEPSELARQSSPDGSARRPTDPAGVRAVLRRRLLVVVVDGSERPGVPQQGAQRGQSGRRGFCQSSAVSGAAEWLRSRAQRRCWCDAFPGRSTRAPEMPARLAAWRTAARSSKSRVGKRRPSRNPSAQSRAVARPSKSLMLSVPFSRSASLVAACGADGVPRGTHASSAVDRCR